MVKWPTVEEPRGSRASILAGKREKHCGNCASQTLGTWQMETLTLCQGHPRKGAAGHGAAPRERKLWTSAPGSGCRGPRTRSTTQAPRYSCQRRMGHRDARDVSCPGPWPLAPGPLGLKARSSSPGCPCDSAPDTPKATLRSAPRRALWARPRPLLSGPAPLPGPQPGPALVLPTPPTCGELGSRSASACRVQRGGDRGMRAPEIEARRVGGSWRGGTYRAWPRAQTRGRDASGVEG